MAVEAPARIASGARVGLDSLVRLRWGAAFSLLVTLTVVARVTEARLPNAALISMIAIGAISNALLAWWKRGRDEAPPALIGGALLLDAVLLTAILFLSGGPANPFSILYLVYVALAAVMLADAWTWSITGLTIAFYGLLFFAPSSDQHEHHGAFSAHLQSMWVAFSVAALLIAYFVARLARSLRAREAELLSFRERAQRSEHLAALTTLAAGAAHELNTPLGTVAVIAKELERRAEQLSGSLATAFGKDARLIRSELERCRGILEQMSARAGESAGEGSDQVPVSKLLDEVRASQPSQRAERLQVECASPDAVVSVPRRALVRVIGNLVGNAFDASAEDAPVVLRAAQDRGTLRLEVEDRGEGMTPDVLERAVEPFFTTKPPGKGLGLGLFLVQCFVDRLGGSLELQPLSSGVRAVLMLPAGQEQAS